MSLVLSNKGKGMQSSSEQPLVGEERYVTTRITAAKETTKAVIKGVFKRSYCCYGNLLYQENDGNVFTND